MAPCVIVNELSDGLATWLLQQQVLSDMYSASAVKRETKVCFLLRQLTDPPPTLNIKPDVDLWSSMSPAKSASEEPVQPTDSLLLKINTASDVSKDTLTPFQLACTEQEIYHMGVFCSIKTGFLRPSHICDQLWENLPFKHPAGCS